MEGAIVLIIPPFLFPPPVLYAETHYRFRYFFSALSKREPEIIFDAPHRLDPGQPLPLLLLVKDGDRYPIRLISLSIELRSNDSVKRVETHSLDISISKDRFWSTILFLNLADLRGWIDIDARLSYECAGKSRTCQNDNYRTSSRAPLRVFVSQQRLPGFNGLHYGDAHTHSSYTDDQVEFGAPLTPSVELARAMGLSFFAVTDHSYDLDDRVDNYLENDPLLPKWKTLQRELEEINNANHGFAIVRGIEVSCRNEADRNVHLLVLGTRTFYQGSGDGAERWSETRSQHSVTEILDALSPSSVAFAAHPFEPIPFLQRLLLRRGSWDKRDISSDGLAGIQFLNGDTGAGFQKGFKSWIRSLLQGKRLLALAGTDAHGNFNRFRQIGIPFITVVERHTHLFGAMRTGVYLKRGVSERGLIEALRAGHFFLTDGPAIRCQVESEGMDRVNMGSIVQGSEVTLHVDARSTTEFGQISSIRILLGRIGDRNERVIHSLNPHNDCYDISTRMNIRVQRPSYLRVEVRTHSPAAHSNRSHFAFSNPIWLRPAF